MSILKYLLWLDEEKPIRLFLMHPLIYLFMAAWWLLQKMPVIKKYKWSSLIPTPHLTHYHQHLPPIQINSSVAMATLSITQAHKIQISWTSARDLLIYNKQQSNQEPTPTSSITMESRTRHMRVSCTSAQKLRYQIPLMQIFPTSTNQFDYKFLGQWCTRAPSE